MASQKETIYMERWGKAMLRGGEKELVLAALSKSYPARWKVSRDYLCTAPCQPSDERGFVRGV